MCAGEEEGARACLEVCVMCVCVMSGRSQGWRNVDVSDRANPGTHTLPTKQAPMFNKPSIINRKENINRCKTPFNLKMLKIIQIVGFNVQ